MASVCTVTKKVTDYTSGIPLEQIERGGGGKQSGLNVTSVINSLTFDSTTPVIPAAPLSFIRTVYILTCLICSARPLQQTLNCMCEYSAESNSK